MKQSAMLEDYLQVHNISPATVKLTRRVFDYLDKIFGDIDIEDFKLQHVEDFQSWVLKSGREKTTANVYVKTMRPVYRWAVKREFIRKDPFKDVKIFRTADPEIHVYTPEEIGAILGRCDDIWKTRVLLGALCGLRRGEILNLRICDIDFAEGTVRVVPRKGTKDNWPWTSKNGRPRTVPLRGKLPSLLVKLFDELPAGQPYICLTPDCYRLRIGLYEKGLLTSECMNLPHRAFNKTFNNIIRRANVKGTFQLSGYPSRTYLAWEDRYGFRRVEFDLPNNASGRKTKERKTECLWMNY